MMITGFSELVDIAKGYCPKRIAIAYIGHAAYAGVIMGAKVPLVTVGRGSASASRLLAIALGVVITSAGDNERL